MSRGLTHRASCMTGILPNPVKWIDRWISGHHPFDLRHGHGENSLINYSVPRRGGSLAVDDRQVRAGGSNNNKDKVRMRCP
jgi:hypothetical protein